MTSSNFNTAKNPVPKPSAQCFSVSLLLALTLIFLGLLPPLLGQPAHNLMRLAQVPLLLLAVFALIQSGVAPWRPDWRRPASLLPGLGLLLVLVSTALADQPDIAFRELALLLGLVGLATAIAAATRSGLPGWFGPAVISTGLVYALATMALFLAGAFIGGVASAWELAQGYDNPRFLNHAQTLLLPLMLAAWQSSKGRWRFLGIAGLAFQVALLLYTRGRATQVALVAAPLLAVLLGLHGSRRFVLDCLRAGLGGGALFCVSYLPVSLWVGSLQLWTMPGDVGAMAIRMGLWARAVDLIQETPWLGQGPMHYASYGILQGAHPHNVYLQWAAEYGVPAALLIVVAVWGLMWRAAAALRRDEARPHPYGLAAFVGCLGALIDGCFSGNFVMPVSQVWLAMSFGLLMGVTPAAQGMRAARWRRPLVSALCAVQLVYAGMTLYDWRSTPPHLGSRLILPPSETSVSPRHWLNGWF